MMKKRPNYIRIIVIAHGKSELLLAEHIKSNLHLPIQIYAENHGKTSIMIDGLPNVLGNNIFKNKTSLLRHYAIETSGKQLKNLVIMPIMDLDETSVEAYKSKEIFASHWLSPYIVPIWNNENLDAVLFHLGLIDHIPNDKEKGKMYRQLFPTNHEGPDFEQVKMLRDAFRNSKNTNMEIFLDACLQCFEEFYSDDTKSS